MGKDIIVSLDVEEGEISDSASVEEISAEVFSAKTPVEESKQQQQQQQQQQSQQIWTMQDLMKYQKKYQMSRNYAPGLYNFAWAQAVQNKPLDDYLTTMNSNSNSNSNTSTTTTTASVVDKQLKELNDDEVKEGGDGVDNDKIVVVDISGDDGESEKEEGELEEGEIDLDTDVVNAGKREEGDNVEKWVSVIRTGLEGITVNDANKSFSGVCSRLEDTMDSLLKLLSENSVPNKDELVQLAFAAIQLVNSVFSSMSQNEKEHSRHIMSRMLTIVKSRMAV
ncbi:hypothetical protein M8C21_004610, partial [Ambrosia artemisiifolia]